MIYDAAFKKDPQTNILGLFSAGKPASVYANQESEEKIIQYLLDELDTIFEGKVSTHYQKHIVQNWSK